MRPRWGAFRSAGTLVGSCVLASCGAEPAPGATRIRFADATAESGLDFVTTSGVTPATQILEVKGGGVALIDHDDDGDLDVFVPNGATLAAPEHGPGCRLFENRGGLRFADATSAAELSFHRWGIGVAVGDTDADGHDDLYVTCYGKNALLHNTGGRFEELTDVAGVGGEAWSAAAAFGDLDRDGDLDLYVANYLKFDSAHPPPTSFFKGAPVFTGPLGLEPEADILYENLGDGTFRDSSESSGCLAVAPGFGLGVVVLDFDEDGLQDIYVGNDSTPNVLFQNHGGLRFDEVGLRSGLAFNVDGSAQATMGIGIADVSGNGFPGVFTTNFSNDTNTLHVNRGDGFFDDLTRRYGLGMVSFPFVGWATAFYDLEHDGDEDLLLFNGHVYPNATLERMDATHAQVPLLFERAGVSFRHVQDPRAGAWLAEAHCDRGAAFGDLDGDGDIDVVVSELNGPLRLLRNEANAPGWLMVELAPTSLGSRIELWAGGVRQTRWIYSGGSFVSASAQYAHFGLPPGQSTADVLVTWPDGTRQRIEGVAANQHLVVHRP
ncbi:MAG: CRTAC1 family protein [Planctomycetes bacterium]|nr:CRTAC1 family protein [Planctomycetota bacterium]